MTCTEALDLIQLYVDEELEECIVVNLRNHLDSCERCRKAFEARQDLVATLTETIRAETHASVELLTSVKAQLTPQVQTNRPQREQTVSILSYRKLHFALAGVAVVIMLAVLFNRSSDVQQNSTHRHAPITAKSEGVQQSSPPTASQKNEQAGVVETKHAHRGITQQSPKLPTVKIAQSTKSSPQAPDAIVPQLVAVVAVHQPAHDIHGNELALGDRLDGGATVVTGPGGRVTLVTRRGSEFTLDSKSKLTLANNGKNATLQSGRLYCRNRLHEFAAINTAAGRIELLGTIIDAAVKDTQTVVVTVVEGKVRLENAHGTAVVDSGKKSLLMAQLPPEDGEAVNTYSETAWYDGRGSMVSDFGEIAYRTSPITTPPSWYLMSQYWTMNLDGSNKHLIRSSIGAGWPVGSPWIPGQRALIARSQPPRWGYPDFTTRRAESDYLADFTNMLASGYIHHLWLIDAATGQDTQFDLPEGFEVQLVTVSPNRKYIALWGMTNPNSPARTGSFESGLWIYDLETRHLIHHIKRWLSTKPVWSPDSAALAVGFNGTISGDRGAMDHDGGDLAVINVQSGEVTDLGVAGGEAAFSPDGTKLVYRDNYQPKQYTPDDDKIINGISIIDLASRQTKKITPVNVRAQHPHWSPDGTKILYTADSDTPARYVSSDGTPVFQQTYDICVAAADGSWMKTIYHQQTGWISETAWGPTGDVIYVFSPDVFVIASDGSGVVARLGGNAFDSVPSAAEKRDTDAAVAAIREAVFQYAVGKLREYEGRTAKSRASYRAAASLFSGLPYKYPFARFSVSDAMLYADRMSELANRTNQEMLDTVCKEHLMYLEMMLSHYTQKHNNLYFPDLAEFQSWAVARRIDVNQWLPLEKPEVAEAMFKCPMGDQYTYTVPAPGGDEECVVMECPNHPKYKIVLQKTGNWNAAPSLKLILRGVGSWGGSLGFGAPEPEAKP